jgi:hypothetical protein
MSLPWSGQQIEWLQAMGLDVLQRPSSPSAEPTSAAAVPGALLRAARGIDLAPLLAAVGVPRDVASRRVFWRLLRAQRKAMRRG